MPLYEYECLACRSRNEVIQKFSDAPLTECEACGGELRKLISSPAIQFKGSGFYITDYARNGGNGASKDASSNGSSSESSASSGTDAGADKSSTSTAADAATTKTPAPTTT